MVFTWRFAEACGVSSGKSNWQRRIFVQEKEIVNLLGKIKEGSVSVEAGAKILKDLSKEKS